MSDTNPAPSSFPVSPPRVRVEWLIAGVRVAIAVSALLAFADLGIGNGLLNAGAATSGSSGNSSADPASGRAQTVLPYDLVHVYSGLVARDKDAMPPVDLNV